MLRVPRRSAFPQLPELTPLQWQRCFRIMRYLAYAQWKRDGQLRDISDYWSVGHEALADAVRTWKPDAHTAITSWCFTVCQRRFGEVKRSEYGKKRRKGYADTHEVLCADVTLELHEVMVSPGELRISLLEWERTLSRHHRRFLLGLSTGATLTMDRQTSWTYLSVLRRSLQAFLAA